MADDGPQAAAQLHEGQQNHVPLDPPQHQVPADAPLAVPQAVLGADAGQASVSATGLLAIARAEYTLIESGLQEAAAPHEALSSAACEYARELIAEQGFLEAIMATLGALVGLEAIDRFDDSYRQSLDGTHERLLAVRLKLQHAHEAYARAREAPGH
jgi:hypothetical protein